MISLFKYIFDERACLDEKKACFLLAPLTADRLFKGSPAGALRPADPLLLQDGTPAHKLRADAGVIIT